MSSKFGAMDLQLPAIEAGGAVLVDPATLYLRPGVLHVLTGPNGSGKSTLLRRLGVLLQGQCWLLQGHMGLRGELTVAQQAQAFARLHGAQTAQASQALNTMNLLDWANDRVGHLSSGQAVRLGLCGVLLAQRPVWLLDEPFNALDQHQVRTLGQLIAQHLQQGGVVVLASHTGLSQLQMVCGVHSLQHLRIEVGAFSQQVWPEVDSLPIDHQSSPTAGQEPPAAHSPNGWQRFAAFVQRERHLLAGDPQSILWSALFHWMILVFLGLSMLKTQVDWARPALWVSALLAITLAAKDWFSEEQRSAWLMQVSQVGQGATSVYLLSKMVANGCLLSLTAIPVSALAALQFGLPASGLGDMLFSLLLGVWAMVPILTVLSLMVLLTRGGSVLVYILALPLLVPVLVFGMEGSVASQLGRSPTSAWLVLAFMGALGALLGPVVGRHLIDLVNE